MRQISKSAQPCHLTDLQSLVAQQVFCFFQTNLQQIAFGSGRKETLVIAVKLAFFQADAPAETFQTPVLPAVGEHFQPELLKGRIQGRHFFLLGSRVGKASGERDEQFRSQAVDGLLAVRRRGEKLLLQTAEINIEFLGIRRIKNPIFRKLKPLRGIFSGRKVKVAVAETPDRLIVLGETWRIEDAGVLPGDGQPLLQIDLHGRLQKQEEIISASGGTEDGIIILVGTIVFAEMKLDHVQSPFPSVRAVGVQAVGIPF